MVNKPKAFLLALAAMAMLDGGAQAASAPTPVLEGPFTQAQVSAGRTEFLIHCTGCHGGYLLGNSGPPLVGPPFLERWSTRSTRELVRFASNNMPFNAPGSLPQQAYVNLIAFILAVNGAKPGATVFTRDSDITIGSIIDGEIVVPVLEGEEKAVVKPARKGH